MSHPTDKEAQFWIWFSANQTRYYEQKEDQNKLFNELSTQLERVDSGLVFEFTPIRPDGVRELTISADGIKEHFPAVQSLVNKAPVIAKWKINAFRQRVPGDSMEIKYDDSIKIGYDDIFFRFAKDSGKIALELNIRKFNDSPGEKNAIFILLDGLIGEYDMETQISSIDFQLLDNSKINDYTPLVYLRGLVDENKKIH